MTRAAPDERADESLRAALWPSLVVKAAARMLPAGSAQQRYRREFLAELCSMERSQQGRYAIGVLSRSWALRQAVTAPGELTKGRKMRRQALLCRLNLHHVWRIRSTEDGGRYWVCVRCGKEPRERVPPPPST